MNWSCYYCCCCEATFGTVAVVTSFDVQLREIVHSTGILDGMALYTREADTSCSSCSFISLLVMM